MNINKINMVKECVSRLPFLIENGYECESHIVENDSEIENLNIFTFASKSYLKKIEIHFLPAQDNLGDSFGVYILKQKKNLDLVKYLLEIGVINDRKSFDLASYAGKFEEKLKHFSFFLEKSFKSNWSDLLLSDKWVEVFVDWSGYK